MSNKPNGLQKKAIEALKTFKLKDEILSSITKEKDISFSLAQNVNDIKTVIALRKKIFIYKEGYPPNSIWNKNDRNLLHFIAKEKGSPVGAVTVGVDQKTGLTIEKTFGISLDKYVANKEEVGEIQKLAVLPEHRSSIISMGLMIIAFEFVKLCGCNYISIFTLKSKKQNVELYKKFGFRELLDFKIFDSRPAVCMLLDIYREQDLGYTEKGHMSMVKKLAKMFSVNGDIPWELLKD